VNQQGCRADRRKSGRECGDARVVLALECKIFCTNVKNVSCATDLAFQPFFLALKDFAFNCAVDTCTQGALDKVLHNRKYFDLTRNRKYLPVFSVSGRQSSVGASVSGCQFSVGISFEFEGQGKQSIRQCRGDASNAPVCSRESLALLLHSKSHLCTCAQTFFSQPVRSRMQKL
jgi:hypothetical protein